MLVVALVLFSAHDVWKRTIPPWLCGVVLLGIAGGVVWGGFVLSPASAVLGALIFWLADLPMGDRAAIFLTCSLMSPASAGLTVLGAGWAGILYVYGIGRFRSMIGFPFFPAVALCASVSVWMTS
jgi:hypothetical protein